MAGASPSVRTLTSRRLRAREAVAKKKCAFTCSLRCTAKGRESRDHEEEEEEEEEEEGRRHNIA